MLMEMIRAEIIRSQLDLDNTSERIMLSPFPLLVFASVSLRGEFVAERKFPTDSFIVFQYELFS